MEENSRYAKDIDHQSRPCHQEREREREREREDVKRKQRTHFSPKFQIFLNSVRNRSIHFFSLYEIHASKQAHKGYHLYSSKL